MWLRRDAPMASGLDEWRHPAGSGSAGGRREIRPAGENAEQWSRELRRDLVGRLASGGAPIWPLAALLRRDPDAAWAPQGKDSPQDDSVFRAVFATAAWSRR